MLIMKDELQKVDVNVDNDELKDLLREWCMDDYKMFGSVLAEVEDVANRIVLINYKEEDNSFVTFDDKANPIQINLVVDDKAADTRKMIVDKYGYVREFLYNNRYPFIELEVIKSEYYSSLKTLKKSKHLYDDNRI